MVTTRAGLLAFVIFAAAGNVCAQHKHKDKDVDANLPKPAVKIALASLGYAGLHPTANLLKSRTALLTVDFVDAQHVLLTYEYRRLLTRQPNEDNSGRMVRAEVVDLASGKVVKQDDWRLHDTSPYLWPMTGGHFLLRVGPVFYKVDGHTLEMTELLRADAALWKVQADQGTNLLTLETVREKHTAEEHAKLMEEALLSGAPTPSESYEIYGFDLTTLRRVLHQPIGRKGFVVGNESTALDEVRERDKRYSVNAVELKPQGERTKLLDIESDCAPTLTMVAHDAVVVGFCKGSSESVMGVGMDAKLLWKPHDAQWTWPYIARTEVGNRFAVQSIKVGWSVGVNDSLDERDMAMGKVLVYDVATGAEAFSTVLTPLYTTFHGIALSPDGMRLATLRDGCLEVFELPPTPKPAVTRAADIKATTAAVAKK
jgi:hypothetical protein